MFTRDSPSFLKVIDANKGIIYKVANSYCRDEENHKDLIQEIILQLWLSFPKYDPSFKLSTWMYRIALNVSISFYRKELYGVLVINYLFYIFFGQDLVFYFGQKILIIIVLYVFLCGC